MALVEPDAARSEAGAGSVAALDLGSNSFHLIIARLDHGELHVIDRLKETVRLAAGLDEERRLSKEARGRALACLARFGERLRQIPPERVRVVGTNTLRRARDADRFLDEAEATLGHDIDVVSGQEEARLIHLAVTRDLPATDVRRLIVDIGGGSTEIVLGEADRMLAAHSLFMGCVSFTRRYFPDGELSKAAFRKAHTAARLELQGVEQPLRDVGWLSAVGTSGTINAIHGVLTAAGWAGPGGVTRDGVRRLRKESIRAGSIAALRLSGLSRERAAVLPGGLAILEAVLVALEVESIAPCGSALREGLLYDLVGRLSQDDARDRTIRRLVEQYRIDVSQAQRVSQTAVALLEGVRRDWRLDSEEEERMLDWAAHLHEVGLAVAYSGYHKHGAYLLGHAFMPGFSKEEQRMLAALVRGHRRRIDPAVFERVRGEDRERAQRLTVLLRLAVLLHRARRADAPPDVSLAVKSKGLRLTVPEGWLEAHPLTRADLERETAALRALGVRLQVRGG